MLVRAAVCCPLNTEPLTDEQAIRHAALFDELAEPVRLRIISLLLAKGCEPATVSQLTEHLGLAQPSVSHHLKRLTEAGSLERRQDGCTVFHTVRLQAFADSRTVLPIG